MAVGGPDFLIEENLIYRVMLEMHDGAAIYGGLQNSVLRGNVVRDVVKIGEGYGVAAYYLDEGSRDNLVERNVSVGVERAVQNHIARNTAIRNNVFISQDDMSLTFARSAGCTFEANTLFIPGELRITQPTGITTWKDNVLFHGGKGKDGRATAVYDHQRHADHDAAGPDDVFGQGRARGGAAPD